MKIQVYGQGQHLVWLPGWGMPSAVFTPLVEALSDRYTFHLVELADGGYAGEGRQWECTYLAKKIVEQVPPAIWFGWSMGGIIALQAALINRQILGLVLLATTPSFVRSERWVHGLPLSQLMQFSYELKVNPMRTCQRFNALCSLGSKQAQCERLYLNHLTKQYEISTDILDAGLRLLMNTDLSRDIQAIEVPSLWLGGQHDRLIAPSGVEAAAAMMKNSQVTLLSGTAHIPFIGCSQKQTVGCIARFLASI